MGHYFLDTQYKSAVRKDRAKRPGDYECTDGQTDGEMDDRVVIRTSGRTDGHGGSWKRLSKKGYKSMVRKGRANW